MIKRITSSVITGIVIIIGITILVAIISQPFVAMFAIPRWERLGIFGSDGGLWFLTVFGGYIIAGGIGTFLAGFFLGIDNLDFNQQCTEAVISGLLIVLFGYIYLLVRLDIEIFLVLPVVSVLGAVGGCWVGRIYDEYHRRINIIAGLIFLTLVIIGISIVMPLKKLPFGCPPSCDGIDLSNQDLTQVEFPNTSLKGANFSGSDLWRADLSNSNLSDADLSNSDLSRVIFQGANLSGANLTNAITEETYFGGAIMPDGKIYPYESDTEEIN